MKIIAVEKVEAALDDKKVLVRYAVVGVIVEVLVEQKEDHDETTYYLEEDLTESSAQRISQIDGKVLLVCEDLDDAKQHRESLVNVI